MKKFLAVYMGTTSGEKMDEFRALDPAARKARDEEGMHAWMAWGQAHQGAILDNGAPLGKTKLVNMNGVSDTKNLLTGYTVVQAESHEEAAKMFENHPHFAIFPGDSVEVIEMLSMPEMPAK